MSDMKAVPDQGNGWIVMSLDAEPGLFFELTDRHGVHHATFFEPLKGPNAFTIGDRVPITCMFDVNWLIHEERRVGLLFRSTFQVKNGGGYLAAYMNQAKGRANQVDVLLKTDDLVIYNYPNRGTMAVLTKIGAEVQVVFEEQ